MAQNMVSGDERDVMPCPEYQADGVPCTSVHVACAECGRARHAGDCAEPGEIAAADQSDRGSHWRNDR